MTPAATEFVGAITFEALTGRPVHTGLFDAGRALDHIKLARARLGDRRRAGHGRLSRARGSGAGRRPAHRVSPRRHVVRAARARDERSHVGARADAAKRGAPARRSAIRSLDPDEGMLAAGEGSGPGRMPEPEAIFAHVGRLLEPALVARGKRSARDRRTDARSDRSGAVHLEPQQRQDGRGARGRRVAAWRRASTLVAGPLSVAAAARRDAVTCAWSRRTDMAAAVGELCRTPTCS